IQVCRKLRQRNINSPILMLTARSLVEQRVEGLDAGADDYLSKPFAVAELLARIRALIRRRLDQSGAIVRYAGIEIDRHRRTVLRRGRPVQLTSKEFSLLEFLLARAPEVVTRSEIVDQVWDAQFDTGTNLVEVYINRLRQKLSSGGELKIIHTV